MSNKILPGVLAASSGSQYKIERSLNLNPVDSSGSVKSHGLLRKLSSEGNRLTYTLSFWTKILSPTGYFYVDTETSGNPFFYFYYSSNRIHYWDLSGGLDRAILVTNDVILDNAAWYHVVLRVNRTSATASDRAKIYINGTESTYAVTGYPNQNEQSYLNRANTHYISGPSARVNALLAEVNFIDGQALTPASFGETDTTTGVWKPKKYTGSYGSNGYYLPFNNNKSSNTIGIDPNNVSSERENATRTNNPVISTAQSKFGGSSLYQPDATADLVSFKVGSVAGDSFKFTNDFTIEGWIRPSGPDRSFYVQYDGTNYFAFNVDVTNSKFNLYLNGPTTQINYTFNSSAWTHIALSRSGSASNNLKLFANGVLIWQSTNTSVLGYSNPSINRIGGGAGGTLQYVDDFRIYNGIGKYTAAFTPAETALGIGSSDPFWDYVVMAIPADGANNSTTIPTYYANIWNPVGLSVSTASSDLFFDTPTSYEDATQNRGNYCVLNRNTLFGSGTLSDGNLRIQGGNDLVGTFGVRSGKWYWEATIEALGSGGDVGHLGIAGGDYTTGENYYVTDNQRQDLIIRRTDDHPFTSYAYSGAISNISNPRINNAFSAGQVASILLDLDSSPKTLTIKVGSTNYLNATFNYNGEKLIFPFVRNNPNTRFLMNFGQRAFSSSIPSGYKTLCSQNLPIPSVIKSNTAFDTLLYTGNGATSSAGTTARTISGFNFSPNMVWLKERTNTGSWNAHNITDSVRGNNLAIQPSSSGVQVNVVTDFGQGGVGGFTSDGFNIVSGSAGGTNNVNNNGSNYVAWAWDTTTTISGNTSGGTPKAYTESYNAAAGFSIIKYIGNLDENHTIPHSLGETPDFAMIKAIDGTGYSWPVYHRDLQRGATESGFTTQGGWVALNTSDAFNAGDSSYIGASSTSIRLNDVGGSWSNDNDKNYIMYLWKEVPGFSKFGLWKNNNGTNGTFIFTDFKPAFILLKNTDNVEQWYIIDNKRATFNSNAPQGAVYLSPNSTGVESTAIGATVALDMYSNGFKIKTTNAASGEISFGTRDYIYAAFAESPFKYSLAR